MSVMVEKPLQVTESRLSGCKTKSLIEGRLMDCNKSSPGFEEKNNIIALQF